LRLYKAAFVCFTMSYAIAISYKVGTGNSINGIALLINNTIYNILSMSLGITISTYYSIWHKYHEMQ